MILDTLDTSFSTEEIVDPLLEAGLTLLCQFGSLRFLFLPGFRNVIGRRSGFQACVDDGIATVDTLPWRRYPG